MTLVTPGGDGPSALDLDADRTRPLPATLAGADAMPARREWARANGFDVLPTWFYHGPLGGVEALDVAAAQLHAAAWTDASATLTLERAHRVVARSNFDATFVTINPPGTPSGETQCVRTTAGTIAMLRVVAVDAAAGTVTLEYKRVEDAR